MKQLLQILPACHGIAPLLNWSGEKPASKMLVPSPPGALLCVEKIIPAVGPLARAASPNTFLRNVIATIASTCHNREEEAMGFGRGALLWLLGVPLPIILLLALFWHH